MVEFLLVIIFVFIVFVSMVQMILLMHAYNTLADAAKEGVRYAMVHGTGLGTTYCSGPGTVSGATPSVKCTDSTGTNVVTDITYFSAVSFQSISTTNNQCSTPGANSINVCYDPGNANTNNSNFGTACSQPGCLVRVTVSHTYTPFFGLGWPKFTLNAAADGIITD
jgi:hypothetical protein